MTGTRGRWVPALEEHRSSVYPPWYPLCQSPRNIGPNHRGRIGKIYTIAYGASQYLTTGPGVHPAITIPGTQVEPPRNVKVVWVRMGCPLLRRLAYDIKYSSSFDTLKHQRIRARGYCAAWYSGCTEMSADARGSAAADRQRGRHVEPLP
ncbi:hypothetical protein C8Q77DRAFT_296760 [Trametes polyzona]|nr:hypothetical protein C8Q77DRAFT_296760 [Trametes polyzona]